MTYQDIFGEPAERNEYQDQCHEIGLLKQAEAARLLSLAAMNQRYAEEYERVGRNPRMAALHRQQAIIHTAQAEALWPPDDTGEIEAAHMRLG